MKTLRLTKVFTDIVNASKSHRIIICQGGQGSSKTMSILQQFILIAKISDKRLIITICSETLPHLKRGAMRDFFNILEEWGMYNEKNHNKSDNIYKINKSIIEFVSADQPGKMKSTRRHFAFLNEINNIDFHFWEQIEPRTRIGVYGDFNPDHEFWVHTNVAKRDDAIILKSTYLDNPYLAESEKKSIESRRDNKLWWQVYGLGEIGTREGNIYHNWQQIDDIDFPFSSEQYFAIDWGFTNSPTVLIRTATIRDVIYVHEEIYQTELPNRILIEMIRAKGINKELIIADSEDPKSIAELAEAGLNVKGSIKFPGYVNKAIENLQMKKIHVTKSSINIIRELRNYQWIYDKKTNKYINTPVKESDHALDALKDLCFVIGQPRRGITQHN